MAAKIDHLNPGFQWKFPYKVYVITSFFVLESILQWIFFIYMDLPGNEFGNPAVCFVMMLSSLVIITMDRFIGAIRDVTPCILYFVFNLIMVELTIIGTGRIATGASGLELTLSILILLIIIFIFSFVGGYMRMTKWIIFVACLCIWIFVCAIGVLLTLTVLLLNEYKITYINILAAIVYPIVLFMISYDARYINSTFETMSLRDCLSAALTIYGEFMLLLITTLNLTKQQSQEYW